MLRLQLIHVSEKGHGIQQSHLIMMVNWYHTYKHNLVWYWINPVRYTLSNTSVALCNDSYVAYKIWYPCEAYFCSGNIFCAVQHLDFLVSKSADAIPNKKNVNDWCVICKSWSVKMQLSSAFRSKMAIECDFMSQFVFGDGGNCSPEGMPQEVNYMPCVLLQRYIILYLLLSRDTIQSEVPLQPAEFSPNSSQ